MTCPICSTPKDDMGPCSVCLETRVRSFDIRANFEDDWHEVGIYRRIAWGTRVITVSPLPYWETPPIIH